MTLREGWDNLSFNGKLEYLGFAIPTIGFIAFIAMFEFVGIAYMYQRICEIVYWISQIGQ